jgi:hypothetical protein
MALGPMAATWNDYFDHYLEGKTKAPPAEAPAATAIRKRTAGKPATASSPPKTAFSSSQPDKADKPTFITKAKLKLAGPVTAKLTLKTAATGQGAIAWRLDGDKDFLPANRLTFPLQATSDWQTHTLEIPTTGRVIHVRVHLPAGGAEFREIELKAGKR